MFGNISNDTKLSKKNFKVVVDYYKQNEVEFSKAQESIHEKIGIYYPSMKLVDYVLWGNWVSSRQ
jgi:hypothetical protein